ncbi:hypothetical protein [Aquimarina algiphila]|uniref:Uncharacterized protein n=1 Tax=Aquimarina algiphila TaxID=2047982 RepID=A0A554VAN4_9FLAO|nr:hypothetical protein [Aquimarina algiphila]TSE03270.1 hypothetical protein FOF46_29665 [Aquimarina algiphila]
MNIRYLLFNWDGRPTEVNWEVLESKKAFYKKVVLDLGKDNLKSIINTFSTIGSKAFLPDGMSWLVETCKKSPTDTWYLGSVASERMVEKLFYDHISKIKSDNQLIKDYMWILNEMIDIGSSKAYLFRENVITYRRNV